MPRWWQSAHNTISSEAFARRARVAACSEWASTLIGYPTQGNPFFIRQILALLAQRAPRPEATTVDSIELPPAVHDVIRQRIESLGAANRDVLAAAAVIGHEFDAPLLASVVDLTLEDTLSAMEPARELGVVERSRSTPHRFQFSHTLLRDVLYAELGWARCGALHFRVAHALAARPLRDDARHLGAVARHYLLAVPSQLDSSVRACTLAATAAREAAGFEAAADLLSRALEKLVAERGDEDTCCALLLTLGFDQLCSGDLVAAWQTLARGAKLADETGRADVFAGFACRMADWLEFGGDEYETRRRLDQALARVPADKSDLHAALLARRAKVHHELPASARRCSIARRSSRSVAAYRTCESTSRSVARTCATRAGSRKVALRWRSFVRSCSSTPRRAPGSGTRCGEWWPM